MILTTQTEESQKGLLFCSAPLWGYLYSSLVLPKIEVAAPFTETGLLLFISFSPFPFFSFPPPSFPLPSLPSSLSSFLPASTHRALSATYYVASIALRTAKLRIKDMTYADIIVSLSCFSYQLNSSMHADTIVYYVSVMSLALSRSLCYLVPSST